MSAFRRPAFWLWLALAAWPPELLAAHFHWELVDPAYLMTLLLWWPVDMAGRLAALALLMQGASPNPWRSPGRPRLRAALGPALAAEVLLGLKTTTRCLAGIVPGLAWLSYRGMDGPSAWAPPLVLGLLGLLPGIHYAVQRLGAPILILRGENNATRALNASAAQMRGKLRIFLAAALPYLAASWILEGLAQTLPEPGTLLLAPPSYALGLLGLWRAWQRLDPSVLAIPEARA